MELLGRLSRTAMLIVAFMAGVIVSDIGLAVLHPYAALVERLVDWAKPDADYPIFGRKRIRALTEERDRLSAALDRSNVELAGALTKLGRFEDDLKRVRERLAATNLQKRNLERNLKALRRSTAMSNLALLSSEDARTATERQAEQHLANLMRAQSDAERVRKQFKARLPGLTGRLARSASRNVASLPMRTLPLGGALITVSSLYLDLRDACEMAREIDTLTTTVGLSSDEGTVENICRYMSSVEPSSITDLNLPQCKEKIIELNRTDQEELAIEVGRYCDCIRVSGSNCASVITTLN